MPYDLKVRIQPRSSQQKLLAHEGFIKAWVNAPPVDGAANESLLKLLSKVLGRPLHEISIVRGHASREKTVRFEESTEKEIWELLASIS
jgi:uncharacterized protein